MNFPIDYVVADGFSTWGVECKKLAQGIEAKQRALLSEAISKINSRSVYLSKEYIYNGDFNQLGVTRYIPVGWQLNTNVATCYNSGQLAAGADIVQYVSTKWSSELAGKTLYLHTTAAAGISVYLYAKTPSGTTSSTGTTITGVLSISLDIPENIEYIYVRYFNNTAGNLTLTSSRLNISTSASDRFPSVHSPKIGSAKWAATVCAPYRTVKANGTSLSSYDYPILYAAVYDPYNTGGFQSTFTIDDWNSLGRGVFINNHGGVVSLSKSVQVNTIYDHKHIDTGHTHTVTAYGSTGGYSLSSGANLAVSVATAGANNTWLETVSATISDAVLNTGGGAAIRLDANETRFKNTALGLFMVAE